MKHFNHIIAGAMLLAASTTAVHAQVFDKALYKKALWMTTRFYGAQRSGNGPNWLIAEHEPTKTANGISGNLKAFVKGKSYVKDADTDGYDLTGGWYDCGDFVKFGQTEFYSAYMLLLGYSEFPAGYDDYYSADYKGYIGASDYTWEGGKGTPNGIPDILDEAKYATDYFMKCVRSSSQFYYQVGDGDEDHKHWCTSSVKSTLTVSEGGESDGSRPVSKATGNTTSMTSLCGAALAVMARVYKPFDPAYAAQCLEKAKTAYQYVMNTTKGNTGGGGFYGAKGKYEPDEVILCMELYRTTGESSYLTAANNNSTFMTGDATWNHNFTLCYNNTEDLAYYLLAEYGGSELAKTRLTYYVNELYKPTSGYILNVKNDAWGVLRYPANQAFVYGLYAKLNGTMTSVDPYALGTIEYIMGSNSKKFSYIVGLGDNYPHYPHHRNFYGLDNDDEGSLTTQAKYMQLGYMVGGSLNDGAYTDAEKSYTYSEGGIDYNAGLVGALGYINSILNTVNTNKFGHPSPALGDNQSICGKTSILLDSKVSADSKKTFTWTLNGTQLVSSTSANTYTATKAGTYACTIDSAGKWQTTGSVIIMDTLPTLNLGGDATLCNPTTDTLDATLNADVTYQWFKDGNAISNATAATYVVNQAGTYKVTVSATGCASRTDEVTVTSNLPVVSNASSYSDGKVTLTVEGDGDYDWYDAATDGNKLGSGKTFTTTISKDTKFYVQDASSVAFTAGPTEKSFTKTAVNWGNIGANFTAKKALLIKGITIYVNDVYNKGDQALTLTLSQNGTDIAAYTSANTTLNAAGYYTFTFSNPVEITAAGNYTLTASGSQFSVGYFEDGPAYDSYQGNADVITFTGCKNTTSTTYPMPGLVNWQIQAGSGCGRAVALATYNPDGPKDTGIEEVKNSICEVYPNPVKDLLSVRLNEEGNAHVSIMSTTGKMLFEQNTDCKSLANGINVSQLGKGIYLLRLLTANGVYVKEFVKK